MKAVICCSALAVMTFLSLGSAQAMEIRTCGPSIRAVPLNDERQVSSMIVQSFAVVNNGPAPVKLENIRLELSKNDMITDTRVLGPDAVARAVALAPRIDGLAKLIPSQFCNGSLLDGVTLAKSESILQGEALIFLQQLFVWTGSRDALRISAGEASARLSIAAGPSKTRALFPIPGLTFVGIGPTMHGHHRWVALQEFAFDIAKLGNGRTHRGQGTKVTDYFVYGQPVRAVADGKVVAAIMDKADSVDQLQRVGEADDAYLTRVGEAQAALISKGFDAVLGNHVVIDHGNGEFSVYAHLKPGSIKVRVGEAVLAGKVFAAVGSSGNSTQPHLHFQLSDCADVKACRSIPVNFEGIRLPVDQTQRTLQSGDIVETTK